jgi:hypothetical protein
MSVALEAPGYRQAADALRAAGCDRLSPGDLTARAPKDHLPMAQAIGARRCDLTVPGAAAGIHRAECVNLACHERECSHLPLV